MKRLKRFITLAIAIAMLISPIGVYAAASDPLLNTREDFTWGVCMHTPGGVPTYGAGNLEAQLHYAAQMGAKLIRVDAGSTAPEHLDKLVQLCNHYGMKIMLIVYIPNRTFTSDFETDVIVKWYQTFATRYDGKHGRGKADYIQIDNEMDLPLLASAHPNSAAPSGTLISHYNEEDLKNLTAQVKAAIEGVKAAKSDIKTVINMSWTHYGMLEYFKNNGVEWDIVGSDWYSNMFHLDTNSSAYWVGDTVYQKFGKPIIICETNLFNKTEAFDENDASNWDIMVTAMEDYYEKDYVIGACFYEMSDEIEKRGSSYNQEANFGLLFTNDDGSVKGPKAYYYRLKKIMGGTDVAKADWEAVKKLYAQDSKKDDDSSDDIFYDDISFGSASANSSVEYITVKPDPIIITPDPIQKEVTDVQTVIRKIPVKRNETFSIPIIIAICAGGIAVLTAIGTTTFLLIRRKKGVK